MQLIHNPSERHKAALQFLARNQKTCQYGQVVYIDNTMARILGTAHTRETETLTWGLLEPQATVTQAIKKKRNI